jgi:hypothetical protein
MICEKRRKLSSLPIENALTLLHERNPKRRLKQCHILTLSSTTSSEVTEARSQAHHGYLPTAVDGEHHYSSQTSRSPFYMADSAPIADCQEWPS